MAENSDIRDVLYDWVAAKSGLSRIVWAFQNQPRPDRPYVMLRLFNDKPMQYTYEQRTALAGSPGYGYEILGTADFNLSIFIIGESGIDDVPRDSMRTLRGSLGDDAVVRSLRRAQIDAITVAAALPNTDYTITIDDVDVTVNSGVAPTLQTIRDALVAAVNSTNLAYAWVGYLGEVEAVAGASSDVLNLYAGPGYEFTVSLGANLTLSSHQGAVDLAYRYEHGINDLTAMLETKSENRVQMDVCFGMSLRQFRTIDVIENVEVEINGLAFDVSAP